MHLMNLKVQSFILFIFKQDNSWICLFFTFFPDNSYFAAGQHWMKCISAGTFLFCHKAE